MKKLNNKGFGILGILLVIIVLAAAGGVGAYVWHKNHKAKTTANSTSSSSLTRKNDQQLAPKDFVINVLAAVTTGNEKQLEQYLSPQFKTFRQSNLANSPCNGSTTNQNYPKTKPLALFCGSLLDPNNLAGLTPAITDYTFKDGQKGKSVDYSVSQTTGDPGTTDYTFKLLSDGKSWQLHDYGDSFVPSGTPAPNPLLGERESLGQ